MSWRRADLTVDDSREMFTVDPQLIVEAIGVRPDWHERAACRGKGPDVFFPTNDEPTAAALELCERCPVQAECAATGAGERHGVWAGDSEASRRRRLRAAG